MKMIGYKNSLLWEKYSRVRYLGWVKTINQSHNQEKEEIIRKIVPKTCRFLYEVLIYTLFIIV